MKNTRIFLTSLFLALFLLQPLHADASAPVALVLTIDGTITQATQEYLTRGIQTAEQEHAQLVILQLNTPGGDILSMTAMTEAMRASTVPVVVYVTPRGAMAASAGTVITLAAHASGMAPRPLSVRPVRLARAARTWGRPNLPNRPMPWSPRWMPLRDGAARKPLRWPNRPSRVPRRFLPPRPFRHTWWISAPPI